MHGVHKVVGIKLYSTKYQQYPFPFFVLPAFKIFDICDQRNSRWLEQFELEIFELFALLCIAKWCSVWRHSLSYSF